MKNVNFIPKDVQRIPSSHKKDCVTHNEESL